MKITQIAVLCGGQDGVIRGDELFRFRANGSCNVYRLPYGGIEDPTAPLCEKASFRLDRAELIAPHSNAVTFGCDYYAPDDEFPLLYSNIYNNYAAKEDRLVGVCCVYRLQRDGDSFTTTLLQLIEIGFCEDASLWKASEEQESVRPYGNFVIDADHGKLYAFVMRDEERGTRYFEFDIPAIDAGMVDERYHVTRVVLGAEDIRGMFDCPYHRYIQGAALHDGRIYSTEGFRSDPVNRPAIRIIDLAQKKQVQYIDLLDAGYTEEAEMIDFRDGVCYYSDVRGNLFCISFDDDTEVFVSDK